MKLYTYEFRHVQKRWVWVDKLVLEYVLFCFTTIMKVVKQKGSNIGLKEETKVYHSSYVWVTGASYHIGGW